MSEIVILGWNDFEPGHRDRWMHHVEDLVTATKQEPGCRRFVVLADPKSPTGVFVQEHYDDAAAFDAHRHSEHLARFIAETKGCEIRVSDVAIFEATRTH